ncbi:MAG: AzlC family ABC transporter permease [Bacteroidaceae bacterium]|nr:AzlC family ABC transporter permease [Bacteroidaceae bacterium]
MNNDIRKGMRDGIPIALGYFAVAFSLGIIAKKAGLLPWEGALCSFFTRASAGEYGVYTLVAVNATYAEVIGMCIVTNLRYILMSTALTQKFSSQTSILRRILTACCVTDEIFGISIAYPGPLATAYTYSAAIVSGIMWAAGCACGIIAGNILPTNMISALSVALYGMFIAIIIPPARRDKAVLIAIAVSFLLSFLCSTMPLISTLSSGLRTILLTILISALAAVIRPRKEADDEQ